jgi:orotidine-5'-phosphate decarboxylase
MQQADIAPKDRLIVALDLPSVAVAEAMIDKLGDSVNFYKIGYQLAYAGGLPLARALATAGKKVFVDLKLHDIGNTVARGVESIATLGATFLTVPPWKRARDRTSGFSRSRC